MKLYDEMPTHVLTEYNAMGGSALLSDMLTSSRNTLASFGRKTVVEY